MATERVLNDPLSGEEVLNSLLDQIRNSLRRDCYLSPNNAYDYYSAEVSVKVKMHDVGRDNIVDKTMTATVGEPPENEDELLEEAEAHFDIPKASPNEVREQSHQPIPVLTQEKGKAVVKKITYAKNKKAKEKANA